MDSTVSSFWSTSLGVAVVALVLCAPSVALACPYCAVREDPGNTGVMLLGAMIALPFLIVATVVPVLRRAAREDGDFLPTDTE